MGYCGPPFAFFALYYVTMIVSQHKGVVSCCFFLRAFVFFSFFGVLSFSVVSPVLWLGGGRSRVCGSSWYFSSISRLGTCVNWFDRLVSPHFVHFLLYVRLVSPAAGFLLVPKFRSVFLMFALVPSTTLPSLLCMSSALVWLFSVVLFIFRRSGARRSRPTIANIYSSVSRDWCIGPAWRTHGGNAHLNQLKDQAKLGLVR